MINTKSENCMHSIKKKKKKKQPNNNKKKKNTE